jgi:CheY-like chemotaxis protein
MAEDDRHERRGARSHDWRERLLVVCDPCDFTRRLTTDMLRFAGAHRITATEYSANALWMMKQARNPILIADGRGAAAAGIVRKLRRADGAHRQAPAVMITRSAVAADIQRARDSGVSAVATRPLAPQILFERLDEITARPRNFIETASFSGPDRRTGRPAAGDFKRRADIEAGLVTPLQAARAEARSMIFERLRHNDPLAARVGRSLERFLSRQSEMTRSGEEIVALHRATLGKLSDQEDADIEARMEIITGLERLVSRRAA